MAIGIAGGFAQEAKVRTSLVTQSDLWVGQRLALVVELLAPGFFTGVPAFDLPDAKGVLLVPPGGSPLVSGEDIGGASHTVQRHELSVFAHRAGDQIIPPFTVRFHFKRNPLDKDAVAATEPLHFTVKLPPGAEKLGSLISAQNLNVEETWKPEPGKAKAGDAFTRSITYSAPDVPAMAFPPFRAGKIEGLGIYPKPPEVLDEGDHGHPTDKRRDTITYVCERPGQFTIPSVRFTWFDLDAKKLQTIDFPARTFEVAPNPAMASTSRTVAGLAHVSRGAAIVLAGVLAASVFTFLFWKTRAFWLRLIEAFRPVHLAPLNPSRSPNGKISRLS